MAVFDVIARHIRRVRPLGRQDAKEVTVIGTRAGSAAIDRIAFVARLSHQRLQGAVRLTFAGYPIQAVVLSRRAEKVLCVFRAAVLAGEGKKGLLRVDIGQRGADRRDLIAADATINQFLRTSPRIELPPPIRLRQWYRQRPIILSNLQDLAVRRGADELVTLVIRRKKFLLFRGVGIFVTGTDQSGAGGAKNRLQRLLISGPQRIDQGRHGLFGTAVTLARCRDSGRLGRGCRSRVVQRRGERRMARGHDGDVRSLSLAAPRHQRLPPPPETAATTAPEPPPP
jgi:hypothetical protein